MDQQHTAVSRTNTFLHTVWQIIKITFIALLIVIPFRIFIAQPFVVSGASMVPTIEPKEYLVIDLLSYRTRGPERGEVITFRYPLNPSTFFVKRIVGLPGETVHIQEGIVSIETLNGDRYILEEPYIVDEYRAQESTSTELAENEYFVLGDNRKSSSDSRVWGPLQERFITGRVLFRLFPLNTFEYLPGEHNF